MRALLAAFSFLILGPVLAQTRQFGLDLHRPPSTLFAVSTPVTLACGDVDGDGDSDCVVGTNGFFATEVSLFRSQAGAWQRSILLSLPSSPPARVLSATFADLDGDLDLDVLIITAVTGASVAPSVRFDHCRNDGQGAFTPVRTTQVPGVTSATLVTGDVDGDSDRDVVIAFTDAAGAPLPLVLSRNDGAFNFQVVPNALPPIAVLAPQLADVDGDSDLDVLATLANDQVQIFVNQNGTFAAGAVLPGNALHLVPADFDRDGDVDVLAHQRDGAIVLLRNVQNVFTAQAIAPAGQPAGGRPVLGDVDGDLDADCIVQQGGGVLLLRNDGSGNFASEPLPGVWGVVAGGDVDGDGRTDVVFGTTQLAGIAAAFGRSGPLLIDPAQARARYALSGGSTQDTADIDGDGRIDVLQKAEYRLIVLRNTGAGEWASVLVPVPFLRPLARLVDVDGDGDSDLIAVNSDAAGGFQVVRNDGAFTFTVLPLQPLPAASIAGRGDFDRDGDTDLLIATSTALTLVRNLGGGTFAAPVTVIGSYIGGTIPAVTDFDGDGDLDLLVAVGAGYCAQLLTNDGTGTFTVANPCALSTANFYAFGLAYADLDGDGDLDAFAYGYGGGRLFLNQGSTFVPAGSLNGVFSSALLQPWFADWDDDGDIDLLQLGGPPQLWLNNGNATFTDATSRLSSGTEFSAAGAADLDGDGDVDVITALTQFGNPQAPLNHLRSLSSLSRPAPGGTLRLRMANEPGILGTATAALPIIALQPRAQALGVPGIAGKLQIDAATAVGLPALVLPAPGGTGDIQITVPPQPALIGFELWAQGLLLGARPAFTPAVHERVLGP